MVEMRARASWEQPRTSVYNAMMDHGYVDTYVALDVFLVRCLIITCCRWWKLNGTNPVTVTTPSCWAGTRIDYVFLNQQLAKQVVLESSMIVQVLSTTTPPSDHNPVVTTIRIRDTKNTNEE